MANHTHRDIVVRCDGRGHKVRLASGGRRFFSRARCPKCRAAVDPTRLRRLGAATANLRFPKSDHLLDRTLWWSSAVALSLSVLTAVVFLWQADRWWPATLLLFGPRWTLLLPVFCLIPLAAARDRGLLLPLGVTVWVVVGPIMGFRMGLGAQLVRPDMERDLRVATFNARGGEGLSVTPAALMVEWNADVAAFQECQGPFRSAIRRMEGWNTWSGQGLCLISRYPILETLIMPAEAIHNAGGSGVVVAHLVQASERGVWITNVHLETPRDGLARIRRGSILRGIELLQRDSFLRGIEHEQARRFADERPGFRIVVGDFNAPPESRIYRRNWGSWKNAFSVAGFGLGGTRLNGWIRARIDHVVVDDAWKVVDAEVGRDVGSDHLPMLATVRPR